jgi:hypothetical protein
MSRIIEVYISEEMEKKIAAARDTIALLEQMKKDADNAVVDLDYSGIPEYLELEKMLSELKNELGDAGMKSISPSF